MSMTMFDAENDEELVKQQPLRVLVLYQGSAGPKVVDAISQFYSSTAVRILTLGDLKGSLDSHNLGKFKARVSGADVALGLLTPDPRDASAAGNLWFELGYWIARKSSRSILLLRPKGLADGQDAEVKVITDLAGLDAPAVPWRQWHEVVDPFIERAQAEIIQPNHVDRDSDEYPYVHLFGNMRHPKNLAAVSVCSESESICGFRRNAILLMSELISVAYTTQKHFEAQDVFRRLSLYLNALASVTGGDRGSEGFREEYCYKIHRALLELIDLAGEFAALRSAKDRETGPEPGLKYWLDFLVNRTEHHARQRRAADRYLTLVGRDRRPDNPIPRVSYVGRSRVGGNIRELAENRAHEFFNWVERFCDRFEEKTEGYKGFTQHGLRGFENGALTREEALAERNFWTTGLERASMFATFIADAMAAWGFEYFVESQRQFLEAKDGNDDLEPLLEAYFSALPHSAANTSPFERWWVYEDYEGGAR